MAKDALPWLMVLNGMLIKVKTEPAWTEEHYL